MPIDALDAIRNAGETQGDHDAVEAKRLGMTRDETLTREQVVNLVEKALYAHDGRRLWSECTMQESLAYLGAYVEGYVIGYREEWPAEPVHSEALIAILDSPELEELLNMPTVAPSDVFADKGLHFIAYRGEGGDQTTTYAYGVTAEDALRFLAKLEAKAIEVEAEHGLPDNAVELEVCSDCLCWIANGDSSGADRSEADEAAWLAKFDAKTARFEQLTADGEDLGFMHYACDTCGGLAGDRHRVIGWLPKAD